MIPTNGKLQELGHDMEQERVDPELPGKELAVAPQTDETVTMVNMDNPNEYINADNMEMLGDME
jgi:hypothetical protein